MQGKFYTIVSTVGCGGGGIDHHYVVVNSVVTRGHVYRVIYYKIF